MFCYLWDHVYFNNDNKKKPLKDNFFFFRGNYGSHRLEEGKDTEPGGPYCSPIHQHPIPTFVQQNLQI